MPPIQKPEPVIQNSDAQLDQFEEWSAANGLTAASPDDIPPGRPLSELVSFPENDPNELLRQRYLCKGGGLLLVGPTGVGKSSLSIQCMVAWTLGQSAFGITPARPFPFVVGLKEDKPSDSPALTRDLAEDGWRGWHYRDAWYKAKDFFEKVATLGKGSLIGITRVTNVGWMGQVRITDEGHESETEWLVWNTGDGTPAKAYPWIYSLLLTDQEILNNQQQHVLQYAGGLHGRYNADKWKPQEILFDEQPPADIFTGPKIPDLPV